MKRFVKGLASLVMLLVLVVGAPLVLLRVGRLDALSGIDVGSLLFVADTGAVLLFLLTVVAWLAWLVVAASVLAEVAAVLSRGRVRIRVPGGGWVQPMVSTLVLAVAAMVASPVGGAAAQDLTPAPTAVASAAQLAAADATALHSSRTAQADPVAQVDPVEQASSVEHAPDQHGQDQRGDVADDAAVQHRVVRGDDLWTIAETYYGDGTRWRSIAAANGLDPEAILQVGTVLRLDGLTTGTRPSEPSARQSSVVVQPGDTLSALARTHLGDAERWPELQHLNASRIANPDVIQPGWRLTLPGDRTPSGQPAATRVPPTVPVPKTEPAPAPDPEPAHRVPTSPASRETAPPPTAPTPAAPEVEQAIGAEVTADAQDLDPSLAAVAGLGTLLAAALSGALVVRRRSQLAQRRIGQRIVLPQPDSLHLEGALARRAAGAPEPPLEATAADVLLGQDDAGQPVLHDVEAAVTTLVVGDPGRVDQVIAAATTGIALQPWSAESGVVVAGQMPWIAALDEPRVQCLADTEQALVQLERRVAARRVALGRARLAASGQTPADDVDLATLRADPDRWEAWAPLLFVLAQRPTAAQWARVQRCLAGSHVGISVFAAGPEDPRASVVEAGEVLEVEQESARLRSIGAAFAPFLLDATARRALIDLFETTAAARTTPAPWWSDDEDLPPNLALLSQRHPTIQEDQEAPVDPTAFTHPTLLLLGPVDLQGCQGEAPTRARRQCVEYAAWIQQHPGRSSTQMSRELMVAETTRRSNMSRLRNWLGTDPDGQLYLPDAYSGRIELHPAVSSDWEHLQLLIGSGVNRTRTEGLVEALGMVRGAPLADAAPGQWHWAEELRTDMASVVRDIGLVLADRALTEQDTDLARWAVNRALTAAPGDEPLMRARIRTEHLAGNRPEVERLVLQVTRQARTLGVDLDDETVTLVQEVMEGRRRALA